MMLDAVNDLKTLLVIVQPNFIGYCDARNDRYACKRDDFTSPLCVVIRYCDARDNRYACNCRYVMTSPLIPFHAVTFFFNDVAHRGPRSAAQPHARLLQLRAHVPHDINVIIINMMTNDMMSAFHI